MVNGAFLMLVCATAGYAYNYLSQCGFADGAIGIIIAAISICGVIGQTVFGAVIDKAEKLDEKTFISIAMLVTIVISVLLMFVSSPVLTIILVVIGFTSASVGIPFLNSMAFVYEKDGQAINYGLGRGTGSAAYALGSALLGQLWAWKGKEVLPIYIIVFAALTLLLVRLMPTPGKIQKDEKNEEAPQISYVAFFKKYKSIITVVIALIMLYFCHMIVNTYIAKIIGNILQVSGDTTSAVESVQGTALFIQAMVELPTMFGFVYLLKKFSIDKLMIIASIIYSIKHIVILFCGSVPMFYASMVLQMASYAVIVPAAVYYSNEHVASEDRNKGQAVFGATATVGGLLASLIGGSLFQIINNVTVVLGIGVAVSVMGTILMFFGIRRAAKQQ